MQHISLDLDNLATPARLAAMGAMLCGLISLTGWAVGLPLLTRVIPGAVSMKVNTAISISFSGASLLMLTTHGLERIEGVAQSLSACVVLLGLATLAEYVFGWELKIDEFFAADTYRTYAVFPGRPSPLTAIALVAVGASLIAMARNALIGFVRLGALSAAVVGAVCLVGYMWDAGELVTDRWLPPVAVNTSLCLVLLASAFCWHLGPPSGAPQCRRRWRP